MWRTRVVLLQEEWRGRKNQVSFFSWTEWRSKEREPAVWGTRVGLLQEEWRERNRWVECMRGQSSSTSRRPPSDRPFQGNSFQDCKIKWRRADKSSRVQPWGKRLFSWFESEEEPSFFDASPNSEEEKKTERERGGLLLDPQTWPSSKIRSAMYRSYLVTVVPV